MMNKVDKRLIAEYKEIKQNINMIRQTVSSIKSEHEKQLRLATSDKDRMLAHNTYKYKMDAMRNNERLTEQYKLWAIRLKQIYLALNIDGSEFDLGLDTATDSVVDSNRKDSAETISNSDTVDGIQLLSTHDHYKTKVPDDKVKDVPNTDTNVCNFAVSNDEKKQLIRYYNNLLILRNQIIKQL